MGFFISSIKTDYSIFRKRKFHINWPISKYTTRSCQGLVQNILICLLLKEEGINQICNTSREQLKTLHMIGTYLSQVILIRFSYKRPCVWMKRMITLEGGNRLSSNLVGTFNNFIRSCASEQKSFLRILNSLFFRYIPMYVDIS